MDLAIRGEERYPMHIFWLHYAQIWMDILPVAEASIPEWKAVLKRTGHPVGVIKKAAR